MLEPEDADNWIVWGLIMRTVGYYQQAYHKFERALKIDPSNETAKFELEILRKIMELDAKISVDQVPAIKRLRAIEQGQNPPPPEER